MRKRKILIKLCKVNIKKHYTISKTFARKIEAILLVRKFKKRKNKIRKERKKALEQAKQLEIDLIKQDERDGWCCQSRKLTDNEKFLLDILADSLADYDVDTDYD